MEQWLRRSHERDDRPLVKRAGPLPDIDPIEELIRILGEANANSFSAGDIQGVRESSDKGRSLRVQRSALLQFFRPRSTPVLRNRTQSPRRQFTDLRECKVNLLICASIRGSIPDRQSLGLLPTSRLL